MLFQQVYELPAILNILDELKYYEDAKYPNKLEDCSYFYVGGMKI